MPSPPSSEPAATAATGRWVHRPALDGIRAVAVIAVIAFHVTDGMAGSWLEDSLATLSRGGFLGVDVFFVLSGYLITTLLLRARRPNGGAPMGEFWLRRARRLLPALVVVLPVAALVTAISTPALEADARRDDILATLFYFANWHFIATDASYFAGFLGASPLRHMWSLAIEEQFYLVWPLALLGVMYLARGRRQLLLVVIGAGIVGSSLLMAADYRSGALSSAYFGTAAHASPLLVGSGMAVLLAGSPSLLSASGPRRVATWASPPLFALIAVAMVTFDDQGAFYYRGGLVLFALVVAGAIWAVEAAPRSASGRFLSLRPVVWIGLISYGLYLWHWPLLLWVGAPEDTSLAGAALVIAATFAAATLSFYLVERPIRERRVRWIGTSGRRLVLALSLAFFVVASAATIAPHLSRSSELESQVDDPASAPCPAGSPGLDNPVSDNEYAWCELVKPDSPDDPVIATIGDSTSTALTPGLAEVAAKRGWGYVQAGQDGCSILPTGFIGDPTDAQGVRISRACASNMSRILDGVRRDFDPDVWIISDHVVSFSALTPDGDPVPSGPALDEQITSELRTRLDELSQGDDQVVLLEILPLGPPVECAGTPNSECDYLPYSEEADHANELLRGAAADAGAGVTLVSVGDIICPQGECLVALDGTLIRYDGTHYTDRFSRLIAPEIIRRAEAEGLDL